MDELHIYVAYCIAIFRDPCDGITRVAARIAGFYEDYVYERMLEATEADGDLEPLSPGRRPLEVDWAPCISICADTIDVDDSAIDFWVTAIWQMAKKKHNLPAVFKRLLRMFESNQLPAANRAANTTTSEPLQTVVRERALDSPPHREVARRHYRRRL